MAKQTLNDLADSLLGYIETEKTAELSKIPVVTHNTEVGQLMHKLAANLRDLAAVDITAEDVQAFRERYGI